MFGIDRKMAMSIFVILAIVPLLTATPVSAGKPVVTYSCSVSVQAFPGYFAVRTTITASGGYLPSPETDYVSSYKFAVLYDTSAVTDEIPRKTTSHTFLVTPPSDGAGAYTFDSLVVHVKGNGQANQLARCTGTFAL